MNERIKLLIGYDGSESADAAVEDIQRAGLPRDTEAIVFAVADVWFYPPPADPTLPRRLLLWTTKFFRRRKRCGRVPRRR